MSDMTEINDLSQYSKTLRKPEDINLELTGALRVETEEPLKPSNGMLWYNTAVGQTYFYMDSGSGGDWIEVG